MIAAFFTSLLFALTAGFARQVACYFGSLLGNALRLTGALLLTGLLVIAFDLHGPATTTFFISGLLGFGLGGGFMYLALPRMGSACGMLIVQTLFVVFSNLGEWIWLGRVPTLGTLLPTMAILLGIGFSLGPRLADGQIRGNKPQVVGGVVCCIFAAIGQAGGALVARAGYLSLRAEQLELHPLAATHARLWGGWSLALVVLVFALLWRKLPRRKPTQLTLPLASLFVGLNVLSGPVIGVACYQFALSVASVSVVAPLVAMAPIWCEGLARFFREGMPPRSAFLGTILGVVGAIGILSS